MEDLVRCQVAEALARTMVESVFDHAELRSGQGGQVPRLGEVLTHQAVGVLVGAALPRAIRIGEIEPGVEVGGDPLVKRELTAVVGGQRVNGMSDRQKSAANAPADGLSA